MASQGTAVIDDLVLEDLTISGYTPTVKGLNFGEVKVFEEGAPPHTWTVGQILP